MAFLDLDEIEQDSKDANIVPHPLKDKLAESEKAAYINAIVFAGLADDDTLSDIELEYGRTRALSLGLNADDFDEAVKTVQSLNGPKERKEFLFEMLAAFTDRTVAMYVLCDMAQAMASDGDLTDDACKFLDSLYRLLLKSDKKPDNPLTPADQKFLADYRPFLAPGKTADASEVVACRIDGYEFPVGLMRFFSPDLKAVQLKGGTTGPGKIRLVGGKYRPDEALRVSATTMLVIKDAEIEFGSEGGIELCGADVIISNTRFVTAASSHWDVMVKSKANQLKFIHCEFECGGVRGAVECMSGDCNVEFDDCQFRSSISKNGIIRASRDGGVVCSKCDFVDCRVTDASVVTYGGGVNLTDCSFVDCYAREYIVRVTGGRVSGVKCCSFSNCHSARGLVTPSSIVAECFSDDGRFWKGLLLYEGRFNHGFVSKTEFDRIRSSRLNDSKSKFTE